MNPENIPDPVEAALAERDSFQVQLEAVEKGIALAQAVLSLFSAPGWEAFQGAVRDEAQRLRNRLERVDAKEVAQVALLQGRIAALRDLLTEEASTQHHLDILRRKRDRLRSEIDRVRTRPELRWYENQRKRDETPEGR